jgi:hypothetical protein
MILILDRAWGKRKESQSATRRPLKEMSDKELAEHFASMLVAGGMSKAQATALARRQPRLDRECSE